MYKNIKVLKEKKSGNIIIFSETIKLVFSEKVYNGWFDNHISDINKKQYQIEYDKGIYHFYHKKTLILSVSSNKFHKIKFI